MKALLLGRPNVGKSTLFNALAGKRLAITANESGTTRDALHHDIANNLTLVDAAGFENILAKGDDISRQMLNKIHAEINTADIILLCVDARDGIIPADHDIARMLHRTGATVWAVATKCDNAARHREIKPELIALGFKKVFITSAAHFEIEDLRFALETSAEKQENEKWTQKYTKVDLKKTPRAVGALVTRDGKYLLVQEQNKKWSLPAGKVESKETLKEATLRELREETNLPGEISRHICTFPDIEGFLTDIFLVETDEKYEPNPGKNILDAQFFTRDEIEEMDAAEQLRGEFPLTSIENYENPRAHLPPNIAIVGRPNVGKSSILNAITHTDRSIVSSQAHTTRDTITVEHSIDDLKFNIIDTAGIRRPGKIGRGIEKMATDRSRNAIRAADVTILVFDITEGITHVDLRLAEIAAEEGKALIIAANKWDTLKKEDDSKPNEFEANEVARQIRASFHFVPWAEVVLTSATEQRHITNLFRHALTAIENSSQKIRTRDLNRLADDVNQKLPSGRIFYCTQTDRNPPWFKLWVDSRKRFPKSHGRAFENAIRHLYDFRGTPIKISIEERRRTDYATIRPKRKPPANPKTAHKLKKKFKK